MERSASLVDQLRNVTDPRPGASVYPLVNRITDGQVIAIDGKTLR